MSYEMRFRGRDGRESRREFSRDEIQGMIEASFERIVGRSSVVECGFCGEKFLVNNQDFHLAKLCQRHRKH